MRWRTDRALRVGLLLPAVLAAGCSPAPSASPGTSSTAAASAPASSKASATAPPFGLPQPGQPLTAATVLDAMRTSPRPDGVPESLQTQAVASAIAATVWTIDGAPWATIVIGASCGTVCSVDLSGTRSGVDGEDVWLLTVNPATSEVHVDSTDLQALPADLVTWLDDAGRSLADLDDGLKLSAAAWLPPPDQDRFRLSYRSGGEEGSCAVELLIDARAGSLLDRSASGC